jgi:hypothetical protein
MQADGAEANSSPPAGPVTADADLPSSVARIEATLTALLNVLRRITRIIEPIEKHMNQMRS